MSANLNSRWIIVGFCWLVVFILTFWNLNTIDSIAKVKEKKEIYLMDEQFWNYNAANISQILKKSASFIQEVESSKLGLFEFESNIRNLALKCGLNAIKLTTRSQDNQDEIIPVKISFEGTIQHAAKWFDRLGLELPHTQVRDVNIEFDESTRQSKFEVSMYYRYNQSTKESSL